MDLEGDMYLYMMWIFESLDFLHSILRVSNVALFTISFRAEQNSAAVWAFVRISMARVYPSPQARGTEDMITAVRPCEPRRKMSMIVEFF
jgi:hypothetical protein